MTFPEEEWFTRLKDLLCCDPYLQFSYIVGMLAGSDSKPAKLKIYIWMSPSHFQDNSCLLKQARSL